MRKMKNNHPHISSNMTLFIKFYRFITKRCTSLKKICTFFGIYIDIKMRLFALSTIDVSKEAR